jgi:hypothetical protein
MVARIKSGTRDLLLTLSSEGEVADRQMAANGAEATGAAIVMIATRDELFAGDRLDVEDAAGIERAA